VAGGADPLRTECPEYASEINHGAHNAGAKCLERALAELTEGKSSSINAATNSESFSDYSVPSGELGIGRQISKG
jgi:hypothetical protein